MLVNSEYVFTTDELFLLAPQVKQIFHLEDLKGKTVTSSYQG